MVCTAKTRIGRAVLLIHDWFAALIVASLVSIALPQAAWAYVDPSVMTYTIQALAGVAVALSAVAGVVFRRTRRALMKRFGIDEDAKKDREALLHRIDPTLGDKALYATADAYESVCKNPTITHKPLPAHTVFLHKGQTETCCGCEITPFHVPHDSDDNVGYFLRYGPHSLCLITDAGNITGEMEHYVAATDQLSIEANYDEGMLAAGFYPAFLKQRISGNRGHLGNTDAAELIYRHRHHLKQVWLCHLSENNNTPQHALDSIDTCFQTRGNCHPADYLKLSALPRTTASDVFRLA